VRSPEFRFVFKEPVCQVSDSSARRLRLNLRNVNLNYFQPFFAGVVLVSASHWSIFVRNMHHVSDILRRNEPSSLDICPKYVVYFGQMSRGPALDLAAQIDGRVTAQPGKVWTPVDFLDLGSRAAVDKALQRLTADKTLSRLDRGIYYRAGTNRLTGKPTTADVRSIVDAVVRRDQTRVVVDGLTAANDLGLTTAVPARITVLTDARLRPIQLGNQRIVFKTVAPSRLYWAGRPAMRVVQAMYWLQDLMDSDKDQILRRLSAVLNDSVHGAAIRNDLRQGLHTLPTWMQSTIRQLLSDGGDSTATAVRRRKEPKIRAATR
jgi:Family of unknown function (DUF6088)